MSDFVAGSVVIGLGPVGDGSVPSQPASPWASSTSTMPARVPFVIVVPLLIKKREPMPKS